MGIRRTIHRGFRKTKRSYYRFLDRLYIPADRKEILRTKNIRLIPYEKARRGGKYSYAEWAHVIGIFQTLIHRFLETEQNNEILDVGCGTGLLAIASEPFLYPKGHYTGIDVMKEDIEFCRVHYPRPTFEFIHFDVGNPAYTSGQVKTQTPWPLDDNRFDMVTALSVWTHLNETDATFYFEETARVLKPGGKAIITFFLLDDSYQKSLGMRSEKQGRFHTRSQMKWIFEKSCYGSDAWLHPKCVEVPESAIGVTEEGLKRLLSKSGLKLIETFEGNWKEKPGVYFQDVLVFQK